MGEVLNEYYSPMFTVEKDMDVRDMGMLIGCHKESPRYRNGVAGDPRAN